MICIDEKCSTVISLAVPSLQNVRNHVHHPVKEIRAIKPYGYSAKKSLNSQRNLPDVNHDCLLEIDIAVILGGGNFFLYYFFTENSFELSIYPS